MEMIILTQVLKITVRKGLQHEKIKVGIAGLGRLGKVHAHNLA